MHFRLLTKRLKHVIMMTATGLPGVHCRSLKWRLPARRKICGGRWRHRTASHSEGETAAVDVQEMFDLLFQA